jgi:prepilin-type N-terminal cleavage/methylation domain-containing protein
LESNRFTNRQLAPQRRAGFTLVELLVVITIIGILVSLIAAASIRALTTARQAALKVEVDQIAAGFEKYKDSANSYPPNLIIDGGSEPIDENQILSDLQRHMRQAFPKHSEPDNLLRVLAGFAAQGANASSYKQLAGGLSAGEACVFWLSGFSQDSQYPISGEGGPSYPGIDPTADPVESRKWVHEFDVSKLGPRNDMGYFDDSTMRYVTYPDPRNSGQMRRINFWQYTPRSSTVPVLYFDVSRHPAGVRSGATVIGPYDPPAASGLHPQELHVHALKVRSQSAASGVPIQFANHGKFQVLHSGIDDAWGAEILERTSAHGVVEAGGNPTMEGAYLLFPTGPFTDEAADTVVNFAQQARIEDAQPQ